MPARPGVGSGSITTASAPNLVAGLHHFVLEYFFESRIDPGNPVLVRSPASQLACKAHFRSDLTPAGRYPGHLTPFVPHGSTACRV